MDSLGPETAGNVSGSPMVVVEVVVVVGKVGRRKKGWGRRRRRQFKRKLCFGGERDFFDSRPALSQRERLSFPLSPSPFTLSSAPSAATGKENTLLSIVSPPFFVP